MVATQEGAYDTLIELIINEDKSDLVRSQALAALAALLDTNPDPFDQRGFVAIMQGLSSSRSSSAMTSNALELALVVCVRHEHNRQNLMRNDILKHLDTVFDKYPIGNPHLENHKLCQNLNSIFEKFLKGKIS